jgi:hypothetical protein
MVTKMKLEIIDIHNSLWLETLQKLRYDVYHLPEYLALEAKRTKTIPQAFVLEDGDSIFFIPYLLRSCNDIGKIGDREIFDIISPYGYPGILLSEAARNNSEFSQMAFKEFQQALKSQNICSAFLRLHPILGENFLEIFPPDTFQENGETVSIDLTLDEGKIWAHTRKGHQSTINKCIRLGLTAKTVNFEDYLDEFIAIYQETMDRVKAKDHYYFSREYFTDLLKLKEQIYLGIVESEGAIVCASLFFESCGIVQAHLGGTKTDFLKQSPFNLLLHHMRLWAKERGNEFLHIGGGVGGDKDPLFTFKSGFSRQRHQFLTLRSIVDRDIYFQLVDLRAKQLNSEPQDLQMSSFFPAYRS